MAPDDAIKRGLAEMVTAFRTEVDAPQARLYRRLLAGVPADVVTESADRLMVQPGRRFLPTPAEWMTACADVVDERRTVAARQAKALQESCDCSEGWRDTDHGVVRCACHQRALELVRAAGDALARPALPPSSEPELV